MKSSVVVPAHNEEGLINDCLDHLLKQTVLPAEVIVIDNNSNDHTFDRVKDRQEQFRKVGVSLVVMSCRYGNQIEARTMGFGTAKYDMIVTIDADTRLAPDWIELAQKRFRAEEIVGLGGTVIYDDIWLTRLHRLVFWYYRWKPEGYFFYGSNGAFLRAAYRQSSGLAGNREFVEKHNLQEPYDDLYLSYMLKEVGPVVPAPELVCQALSRQGGDRVAFKVAGRRLYRQFSETRFVQRYLRARLGRATISRQ